MSNNEYQSSIDEYQTQYFWNGAHPSLFVGITYNTAFRGSPNYSPRENVKEEF